MAADTPSVDAAANRQFPTLGDGVSPSRDLLLLASEELRGPLTSVAGYLRVLGDGELGALDPGQARVVDIAARNAVRMERLLDSLIVVSQLHHGGADLQRMVVADLVRDQIEGLRHRADARGVHLGLGVDGAGAAMVDPVTLARAAESMVEHAMTFATPGGTVDVIVRDDADDVVFEVQDDGIPLEAEHLGQVFAGRLAPATAGPRLLLGSRLELFMVRLVAEAHGGSVAAAVAADRRSRLMMRLPRLGGGAAPRADAA